MRPISIVLANIWLLLFITFSAFPGDLYEDFSESEVGLEPGDGDWVVYDEEDLGDVGPSSWQIGDSPLDDEAMTQNSNIWGDATDAVAIGSFVIYDKAEWADFALEVDVLANDNDGMGLVWAYTDTDSHYRAIMINDRWPDVSVDGVEGPFMKIAKRISDEDPWYELLAVEKDNYVPYPEGPRFHWTLEVEDGAFTFTREDGLSVSAEDQSYATGYVGIQLYAQQAEFDNFTIAPRGGAAVSPGQKMASVWGAIKR